MRERLFPLDLAYAALPLVRSIVADLVASGADIERVRREFERVSALPGKPQGELNRLHRDLRRLEVARRACGTELDDLGVRLEDSEAGICDFPAELDGEPVMLCWKLGEKTLAAYHGPDEGFKDRRPLPVPVEVQ